MIIPQQPPPEHPFRSIVQSSLLLTAFPRILYTGSWVSENMSSRDCLETPTHGLTASPSAASSPRRQRTLRCRTTSRSPWPSSGCRRSTRRCAPPPTSSARPEKTPGGINLRQSTSLPSLAHSSAQTLATCSESGFVGGLRTTSTLTPRTSSAHLLPLPR